MLNAKMLTITVNVNQVRKTPEGDVSVPINMAYNHHHDTAVVGKSTKMIKVDMNDPRAKNSPCVAKLETRAHTGSTYLDVQPREDIRGRNSSCSGLTSARERERLHTLIRNIYAHVGSNTMLSK